MTSVSLAHASFKAGLADPDTNRAVIYIHNNKIDKTCSGVMIHPRVALTAGHCLFNMDAGSLSFSNSGEVAASFANKMPIEKIATKPGYRGPIAGIQAVGASGADLGIIVFKENVLSRFSMRESDLPALQTRFDSLQGVLSQAKHLELVGYGHSSSPQQMNTQQTVKLHFNKRRYNVNATLADDLSLIRAQSPIRGQTSCFGDSGGPFFSYNDPKQKTLVGILTSILPSGSLEQDFARERASLRAKAYKRYVKQTNDDQKKGVAQQRSVEAAYLPQAMLWRTCGHADTIQHITPIAAHLCWIQSASNVVLDSHLNCSSPGDDQ